LSCSSIVDDDRLSLQARPPALIGAWWIWRNRSSSNDATLVKADEDELCRYRLAPYVARIAQGMRSSRLATQESA